jgi:hypothetical protein
MRRPLIFAVRGYIPSLPRVSLSSWPVTFKPSAFW